ncbi:type I-C CRISPR-associated protein Cas7/Csd2 [Paraglaciecola aquimarina]|uniref:Type I-C CRISPR-associated protein Cas7/Csd2 n=1 Tax=Paraglaciecola aquimarina TaxID=1235557 RepID=A0ABU3T0Q6_9ALTE|nr:type I-C CRISPR-associated protein Cas7/Csd2 [Paraglaciecola aquimarina]MDU0355808.1 type I-C CRISPR-associated protein Cas7/Csd2 [Paraglaciecola aquimarina]
MSLQNKIDFAVIFSVKNANPNGDPLNGNRPRTDFGGYGEVTDVCLKRKLRDRLIELQESIFVQSDENKTDGMTSLRNRAESEEFGLGKEAFNGKKTPADETAKMACDKWFDVRSFGQIFAYKGEKSGGGVSIAIRGPVTIQSAFSIEPVGITSTQITKSVSGEGDGEKKASDTMGMKHRVDEAIYIAYGAMTPQLAERTGFSNADAEIIKQILPKLFEGDASSARPEGSMAVEKVIWWQHNSKAGQYSSAKVHRTLDVNTDGTIDENKLLKSLDGLKPEIIDGF